MKKKDFNSQKRTLSEINSAKSKIIKAQWRVLIHLHNKPVHLKL